jgi:elongation of very long chain fatty acids protein 7
METFKKVINFYHEVLEDYGDPRVKDWFGMSSPFPTIGLSLTYVLIVKVKVQSSK